MQNGFFSRYNIESFVYYNGKGGFIILFGVHLFKEPHPNLKLIRYLV